MRALLCIEPGRLAVVERARPSPGRAKCWCGSGAPGVCGTDLHIYEGSHPFLEYPRVIGHELSGEVAETGPGLRARRSARRSTSSPICRAGSCVACRRGKTNCCQRIAVLGVHIDGGMAEYVCVPEANLAPADGVTLDQAAMVEFLVDRRACGAPRRSAARRPRARRRSGPIGLGCMIFAQLARRLGRPRSTCAGPPRLLPRRPRDRSDGRRRRRTRSKPLAADRRRPVRHRVSTPPAMRASMTAGFDYVAHGGTYVLVSVVRDTISFADPKFHAREIVAARQPQRDARRTSSKSSAQCATDTCRPTRSPPIARRSNNRPSASPNGSGRRPA